MPKPNPNVRTDTVCDIKIELRKRGIVGITGKRKAELLHMLNEARETTPKVTPTPSKTLKKGRGGGGTSKPRRNAKSKRKSKSKTSKKALKGTAAADATHAAGRMGGEEDRRGGEGGDARNVANIEDLIQLTTGNKDFMRLCAKHIMVSDLDGVVETTWLNNNDSCNIFLIGETHKVYTKCQKIFDMFTRLINDEDYTSLLDPSNREIDLMLELSQQDAFSLTKTFKKGSVNEGNDSLQINNVRRLFRECVLSRVKNNCTVRVHWTDPTSTNETDYDDLWLNKLEKYTLDLDASWTEDPVIAAELKGESDIYKLITKNKKVVKEIKKATRKNKKFTLDFVKTILKGEYDRLLFEFGFIIGNNWKSIVIWLLRCVMDIYTVARIFSFEMKNVIIYGGNRHTIRIKRMLSKFNFKTIKVVKGECPSLSSCLSKLHEFRDGRSVRVRETRAHRRKFLF